MSVTTFNAMISGLLQLGSAYESVVTKKSGQASKTDLLALVERESQVQLEHPKHHRVVSELGLDALSKLDELKHQ